MIPKDSTPVKHKILTEIFAKRRLTLNEIAIVSYIMRWSWGFDDGERRQDWTGKLIKRKMANDIGMLESHLCETINKMILENKIIVKDKCYQFNEHYEKWKNFPKKEVFNKIKLPEKGSKTSRKGKENFPKKEVKLPEKGSLSMPNNQGEGIKNKDVKGGEHLYKDTLKDNKDKKDKNIRFNFIKKEFSNLTKEKMEEFDKKYPGIDIDQQIERMENWLMGEKEKRDKGEKDKIPKDYNRFINNWLRKEEQQ